MFSCSPNNAKNSSSRVVVQKHLRKYICNIQFKYCCCLDIVYVFYRSHARCHCVDRCEKRSKNVKQLQCCWSQLPKYMSAHFYRQIYNSILRYLTVRSVGHKLNVVDGFSQRPVYINPGRASGHKTGCSVDELISWRSRRCCWSNLLRFNRYRDEVVQLVSHIRIAGTGGQHWHIDCGRATAPARTGAQGKTTYNSASTQR